MAPLQVARALTGSSIDSAQSAAPWRADATVQRVVGIPVETREGDPGEAAVPNFELGASVCLFARLPYLKTADPMPMLRPPDLVDEGEVGQVVALRAQDTLAVRFRRGTFLIAATALRPAMGSPEGAAG